MPCRTYEPEDHKEDQRKINKLEAMLCSACKALEKSEYDFDANPMLSNWWDKHKKEDEARIVAEKAKKLREEFAISLLNKKVSELTHDDLALLKEFGFISRGVFVK